MIGKITTITKRKGQGIVEYALLLAFVVGIAMMLRGVGLAGAVKDTFDSVASVLGAVKDYADSGVKDYAYALKNWSKLSQEDLKKISNDDRVLADQEALANIGEFFIGMAKSEVANYLSNVNAKNSPLTHIREETNETGLTNLTDKADEIMKNDEDVFHWMQHDYGTVGENGERTYNSDYNYATDNRYLFSNYAVTNAGTDSKDHLNYGNGVKLTLTYEKIDNKEYVKTAKVVIDQQAIDDKMNNKGGNGDPRLAMTVSKDSSGNIVREATYKNWIENNSDKLEH